MIFYCLLAVSSIVSIDNLEPLVADCQFCTENPVPMCDAYLKPCTYSPFRCDNFWTGFEILIWRACEDGFSNSFGDVSIVNKIAGILTTTTFTQTNKDLDFDWDAAFRASIGYDFAHCGTDLGFYWTRFYQKTNTRDGINRAHWQLHFDTIDGACGHHFWVDTCIDLFPFATLRYAQIAQRLNIDLKTIYTAPTEITHITTTSRNGQKLRALGPIFGLKTDWYLRCGFSIYGTIDTGILYGYFKTENQNEDRSLAVSKMTHCKGHSCASPFVIDLGIGIRYETQYVTLRTGLEHHRYSEFNQIGCPGSLNLFGANLGLEIHY
ncbi:MAG TPA: Lpg1974 family pore-forming outer membrane protein [Chlamydiales bacterium]|nr:Lpg1974 family pore-forming outer membrane protein [Chlamydiales bacterium]